MNRYLFAGLAVIIAWKCLSMTFRPQDKPSLMLPPRLLTIAFIALIAMNTLSLLAVVLRGRIEHLSQSHLLALPLEISLVHAEAADNIKDAAGNELK
ncbi:MAG TPA: hypothetical protein VFE32_13790 [Puia sp.]|jgi:hypothetical protein|nr:hypothetical protein [Puia sp.]